jgi:hypothetical protein
VRGEHHGEPLATGGIELPQRILDTVGEARDPRGRQVPCAGHVQRDVRWDAGSGGVQRALVSGEDER